MGVQMNLKHYYQQFLHEYLDEKWLQHYPNVKVLAENFIKGKYYVVIFEADNQDGKRTVYILVENFKKVKAPIDLKTSKNGWGYIISKQHRLKRLHKDVYNHIVSNGVFELLATEENDSNSTCSIQRLVYSFYDNCLNNKIHHINRKRDFSPICNLVSMEKYFHKHIHKKIYAKSFTAGVIKSLKEQNKLKVKLRLQSKKTLAQHPEVIKDILLCRCKKMNAKVIEKQIKRLVGKTKIQEYINYFFYTYEFLKWLFDKAMHKSQRLIGNFENRWEFILKFDRYVEDKTLEIIDVIELIE